MGFKQAFCQYKMVCAAARNYSLNLVCYFIVVNSQKRNIIIQSFNYFANLAKME